MFDVQGFILVGGASSRMGSDKAQLKFHGQTGVELIAAALRPNVVAVRLVGSREEASLSQLQNVPDLHERWGALGGIHAALYACQSAWAAIVACDLPLVTDELFERLWQFAKEPFDAVVPLQPDGRQPLNTSFSTSTRRPIMNARSKFWRYRTESSSDRIIFHFSFAFNSPHTEG